MSGKIPTQESPLVDKFTGMRPSSGVQPIAKGFPAVLCYESRTAGRRQQLGWIMRGTMHWFDMRLRDLPTPTGMPGAELFIEDEQGFFPIAIRILRTAPNVELEITDPCETTVARLHAALSDRRRGVSRS